MSARSSDSYLCPHGFDKRSVHCARCADPAFDSARGCEVAKAAMHTMHSSTGGPTVMTDHIPPGTKPTGASKEHVDRVVAAARRAIEGKRIAVGSPLHLLEMFIKIVEDRPAPETGGSLVTECCQREIAATDRFCPSCGHECRVRDALKATVLPTEICPTGDVYPHKAHKGKCMYCGAPMPSESEGEQHGG